jgi:hypothetical protein
MGDFIGYEPNQHRLGGFQEPKKRRQKVPSDLINVLPVWTSFQPSDRMIFKKKLVSMLRQCQAMYLLSNVQYEVPSSLAANEVANGAKSRVLSSPFTPAPIRRSNGPRYPGHPVPWTAPPPNVSQVLWHTPSRAPHARSVRRSAPARNAYELSHNAYELATNSYEMSKILTRWPKHPPPG